MRPARLLETKGVHCFQETTETRLNLRIILPCSTPQGNSWAVLKYTLTLQYASTSSSRCKKKRLLRPRRLENCPKGHRGPEKGLSAPGFADWLLEDRRHWDQVPEADDQNAAIDGQHSETNSKCGEELAEGLHWSKSPGARTPLWAPSTLSFRDASQTGPVPC